MNLEVYSARGCSPIKVGKQTEHKILAQEAVVRGNIILTSGLSQQYKRYISNIYKEGG